MQNVTAGQSTAGRTPAMSGLTPFVIMLFFAWGLATVLVDTVVPRMKAQFSLNYVEAMLTQFAFFLAYFIMSIPAGGILTRVGYLRGIVCGLGVMALGCLLFLPASWLGVYPAFLLALFVMASGITILQVAANPLMSLLGPPETAPSRLSLAQAFNSLGTTFGPMVGSVLILSHKPGGDGTADAATPDGGVQLPFLVIAAGLVLLALLFWKLRHRETRRAVGEAAASFSLAVLAHPRLALGAIGIFVYVGAEVSIGSAMVNYLTLDRTQAATETLGGQITHFLHLHNAINTPEGRAGSLLSLYWGGAMVGRFIGSAILRHLRAGLALAGCALAAALLVCLSMASSGDAAVVSILAVGLFNSIMFPTIFTLAIEGLGDETPHGAGVLCLAIVGGAVVPLLTGFVADSVGLVMAYWVPVICYALIGLYGSMVGLNLLPASTVPDAGGKTGGKAVRASLH